MAHECRPMWSPPPFAGHSCSPWSPSASQPPPSRGARRDEAAEDSGAGSKAAAALVTSLLHVVPISLAQATDYASDVIVASSLLASGDAQQAALGWIAVGALGLSLVFAWVSLLGFACEETYSPYGRDHSLAPHQLLTAAVLAPFNLHVLYLGVVYSRAIAGADRGDKDRSPKYQSAGWYYMFVTLKLLETSVESVPLAVVVVAAIVAGGGTGSVLLWASLSITCLSMSYGLFMQAMENASDDGNTLKEHQASGLRSSCACSSTSCGPSARLAARWARRSSAWAGGWRPGRCCCLG